MREELRPKTPKELFESSLLLGVLIIIVFSSTFVFVRGNDPTTVKWLMGATVLIGCLAMWFAHEYASSRRRFIRHKKRCLITKQYRQLGTRPQRRSKLL